MRGWLFKRKPNKDEKGFSLIEMVIAIPLIALSGGFVVTIIAQSFGIVNQNQAINAAGTEVQSIMDEVKNAKTCYDLEVATNDFYSKNTEPPAEKLKKFYEIPKKGSVQPDHPSDFTVTTTFRNTTAKITANKVKCATTGADSTNQVITVESVARSKGEKILFKNQTTVQISG